MVFLKVLTIAAIAAVGMLASVGTQLTYGLGSINSQGVQAHQSDPWNQAGFSGEGIKVGIIENSGEGGFFGYQQLMGTELPTSVAARCYTRIGQFVSDIGICDTGGDHGTNVAETVADIAPEVSLYIANPGTAADLRSTVNWMVSEGVSVINHSAVWAFDGPPDGIWDYNFSIGNSVKRAMDAGIVWVNSAGNDARRTWFGPTTFTDDGEHFEFLEFQSNDIFNDIAMETGDRVWINLRWDDNWAGARRDLDLSLWSHSEEEIVAASLDYQNGLPGEFPIERLSFTAPRQGVYGIVVSISVEDAPDKPNWAQLIVSSHDISEIESFTLAGSIRNPAELSDPRMMAVGASHWADTHVLEPYSSRGPTPDGRTKPEIVGVACGETSRTPLDVAGRGFCGTSQASPHVAGMAALVRQRFPDFTPVEVANYLKENAEQRDSPDPNNVWGYGFAKLPPVDRAALEVLYNATGGDNWLEKSTWITSGALSTWHGVTTDSQGRVTELNLTRNQLKGELPPELANLTNLKVLALGGNQLTGKIPAWLDSLMNLQELYLWGNELNGEIPAELGNLTNLEFLSVRENHLSGTIPVELGNLTNLTTLSLSANQLTGGIPDEMALLTDLQRLSLYDNQLTGKIPAWLDSLMNLQELYLWGNELNGEIPGELGSLTNLTILELGDNELTGPIPTELGSLTNLTILDLGDNELTGPIPTELGSIANLQVLALGGNQLTGTVPAWLDSLTNLQELYLWGNELNGEIPGELGSLTNLTILELGDNELTGPIPTELGSIANLQVLALGGNQLTGTVPAWLDSLTNLQVLALGGNQLTGTVPAWLDSLTNLQELYLWGNELNGEIPGELGSLTNLTILELGDNELTGPIPTELGSIANLQVLAFGGNQLTGKIPAWLGSLSNLERIALSANQLNGEIPVQLGDLTNLEVLFASGNELTGGIPDELALLTNLQRLSLYDNQLTGTIPSWLGLLTNLDFLSVRENQLSGTIPVELGNLINLTTLSLSANQLTGEIPAELGRLDKLEELHLSENQLTGCIPATLRDVLTNDLAELGLPFCVSSLVARYDANDNGTIEKNEVIEAINDYLFGDGDEAINKAEVIELINLYLFG